LGFKILKKEVDSLGIITLYPAYYNSKGNKHEIGVSFTYYRDDKGKLEYGFIIHICFYLFHHGFQLMITADNPKGD